MYIFFILSFLFTIHSAYCQVYSRIQWLADSIALGYPTPVAFSVHYPVGYSIIFPDTAHDFFPFEVQSKKIFPTQVYDNYATDSVIYYLLSFQIDSIQKLQLSFACVYKLDTTFLKSEVAKIPFQRKVFTFNNQTPYLYEKELHHIPVKPNYALILSLIFGFFFLTVILFFVFKKPVYKWIQLLKLKKEWKTLLKRLERAFHHKDAQTAVYEFNSLWKNYLNFFHAIHPQSLTSKEFRNWINSLPAIENPHIFIEWCELEERIFYASEKIDISELVTKKKIILKELQKVYKYKTSWKNLPDFPETTIKTIF